MDTNVKSASTTNVRRHNINKYNRNRAVSNRHFSLLNVKFAGACGYDFVCDGRRLVRAYLGRRRGRYEELLSQNYQQPTGGVLNETR